MTLVPPKSGLFNPRRRENQGGSREGLVLRLVPGGAVGRQDVERLLDQLGGDHAVVELGARRRRRLEEGRAQPLGRRQLVHALLLEHAAEQEGVLAFSKIFESYRELGGRGLERLLVLEAELVPGLL